MEGSERTLHERRLTAGLSSAALGAACRRNGAVTCRVEHGPAEPLSQAGRRCRSGPSSVEDLKP